MGIRLFINHHVGGSREMTTAQPAQISSNKDCPFCGSVVGTMYDDMNIKVIFHSASYREQLQKLRTENIRLEMENRDLREERKEFMLALMAGASRKVNHS